MYTNLRIAVLVSSVITSILMLLVAFNVTSLGVRDRLYGSFGVWIPLCIVALVNAVVVFFLRREFGVFRYCALVSALSAIALPFPVNHLTLAKVFSVIVLGLAAVELFSRK